MIKIILAISIGGALLLSVGRMFFISRVREELSAFRYSLTRLKTLVRGTDLHAETIVMAEQAFQTAKGLLIAGKNIEAWRFLKAQRSVDLVAEAIRKG